MDVPRPRAVVFIDGANLYYLMKDAGVRANQIDPYLVARKLVEHRSLEEVRYYIAEIDRNRAPERVFRAFEATRALLASHANTRLCTGHIQHLSQPNPCAADLASYLASLPVRLRPDVYRGFSDIVKRHRRVEVKREKGVDVYLACDLVDLAWRDAYDVGYLVSGDADFCPAVGIVRAMGKRVFVAAPDIASRLIEACDVAIPLGGDWLRDCRI